MHWTDWDDNGVHHGLAQMHLQSCRHRPIAFCKQLTSANYGLRHNGWCWRIEVTHGAPARNDETKRSDSRDETPRPLGLRPDTHKSETDMRPRCWALFRRRDRNETLVLLETETSRPRPHPRAIRVALQNLDAVSEENCQNGIFVL